jgi:WD40 repeat protein
VGGSYWPGQTPGELGLWDMVGKSELHRLYEGPDMVWSARFSPDGHKIAAAFDRTKSNNPDKKGTLVIWDAQTGQRIRDFVVQPARHVRQLAWSPDGKQIATISMHRDETNQHGPVQLWDCATAMCETVFDNPKGDLLVSLAYAGDGKTIAAGSVDGTIHLWQISDGAPTDKPGRVLTGHSSMVLYVDFSPDGRRLVSCGSDGTVRVWNVVTGAEELIFRESSWILCARFSHDGRTLAVGTDAKANVRFYRAASDQQVARGLLANRK